MSESDAIIYLKTNVFEPHQNGNYGLYGLNMFGCDSTIKFNDADDIWHFLYFVHNTAVYINAHGRHLNLSLSAIGKPTDNITRMQVKV
jgi:hypothetical protein